MLSYAYCSVCDGYQQACLGVSSWRTRLRPGRSSTTVGITSFFPTPMPSFEANPAREQALRIPVREDLEPAGRDSHDGLTFLGLDSVLNPIHSKRRRLSIQYVISYYTRSEKT